MSARLPSPPAWDDGRTPRSRTQRRDLLLAIARLSGHGERPVARARLLATGANLDPCLCWLEGGGVICRPRRGLVALTARGIAAAYALDRDT